MVWVGRLTKLVQRLQQPLGILFSGFYVSLLDLAM